MLVIREHATGDVTVLRLEGRLVLEDAETPLIRCIDRLFSEGRHKLVLDLRRVTYIDSAGLGWLVAKYVGARRRGGDLRFVHLTERTSHLMAITNLRTVFDTFESEDEAVESFADSDRR